MKKLQVGVIGCGAIGRDHVRRIHDLIPDAEVVAVADYLKESADALAREYGLRSYPTGEALIQADEVEAVLIASSDPTHAGFVLEGLAARKYIFCEKPLAQTAADCEKIMQAEMEIGRPMVQVGFMRRYDTGYAEIKRIIDAGEIGAPLLIHAAHRNVSQPAGFQSDMAVTNVAIHELDICRWLLNDEYESAQVLSVRQNTYTNGDYLNPQLVMLETKKGARIMIEVQCSGAYAYDIRCEVVGELGTAELPDPPAVTRRLAANQKTPLLTDWKDRFTEAYDTEFQQWAKGILEGIVPGPKSWDGYVACVTADAALRSRETGVPEKVALIEKPEIYR